MPDEERGHEQNEKTCGPASVPNAQRPIREICKRRAHCGRGDNGRPINDGVKLFRTDLNNHRPHKDEGEYGRADEVPEIHGHGKSISTSLTQSGRKNLDELRFDKHAIEIQSHGTCRQLF